MLGLSMVDFVFSVPACTPFLGWEEGLVADKRVCEVDLFEGRGDSAIFVELELEEQDMALVGSVSCSGISSGISSSPVFPGKFPVIITTYPVLVGQA